MTVLNTEIAGDFPLLLCSHWWSLHLPMALLCCSQICPQVKMMQSTSVGAEQQRFFTLRSMNIGITCRRISSNARRIGHHWSFLEGSRVVLRPQFQRVISKPNRSFVSDYFFTSSQIASIAFSWGTVAVLPFYTLMVLVPRSTLTRRVMESNIQYAVLGILYGYLLLLSWTPDTLRVIFATKYLLPELPGMTKMFANEMTMASAWIHLLAVDLYAARQVFHDGLKNNVETRHSVALCLLFCPIGILTHAITKIMTKTADG